MKKNDVILTKTKKEGPTDGIKGAFQDSDFTTHRGNFMILGLLRAWLIIAYIMHGIMWRGSDVFCENETWPKE